MGPPTIITATTLSLADTILGKREKFGWLEELRGEGREKKRRVSSRAENGVVNWGVRTEKEKERVTNKISESAMQFRGLDEVCVVLLDLIIR